MPEYLFPILTGLTLVFAGILVGYFLWFRDRNEHDDLSEQLTAENEQLNSDLQARELRNRELDNQIANLELKNTSLEQLCDDLLTSRDQAQFRTNELESELDSTRRKLSQTTEQLNVEYQKRLKSDENSHLAQQQIETVRSDIDELAQKKVNQTIIQLDTAQRDLQHQRKINQQLQEKLQAATAQSAQLKSELSAQQNILSIAKSNAAGLEKEHSWLEENLRSQIKLLNESRGQTAAAESARESAEVALRENKDYVQHLNRKLENLESELREQAITQERSKHLELSMQMLQERLESVMAQRDDFGGKLEQALQEIVAFGNRVRNQQTTIEHLRAETMTHDQQQQQLKQELTSQVNVLQQGKSVLLSQIEELKRKLDESGIRRAKNDAAIKRVSEENAHLIAQLTEYEKIDRDDLMASEQYKARIESAISQRDSALVDVQNLETELKKLKSHAKSNEETIRNLRRERGAILMRNREYASVSYPRIHSESLEFTKVDQIASEYGGTLKTDPVRGPVFVEPPRQRDDLKKISGIAGVLEERLNDFGIYTFKQIMEWDEKTIHEFSELLAFKDRITRDDWVGQAGELYHQKSRNDAA